jgi:hypothetical protein
MNEERLVALKDTLTMLAMQLAAMEELKTCHPPREPPPNTANSLGAYGKIDSAEEADAASRHLLQEGPTPPKGTFAHTCAPFGRLPP